MQWHKFAHFCIPSGHLQFSSRRSDVRQTRGELTF